MLSIQSKTFAGIYEDLRALLLNEGRKVDPRGLTTQELAPVSFTLMDPRSRFAYHPFRHYHLPFAVAESICLFAPTNLLANIAYFMPAYSQFSDDGISLYGAYGCRVSQYIEDVINKLEFDSFSRQAVLQIFENRDIRVCTKDVPCTVSLQFMIRDDKLHMHTYMR